MSWTDDIGNLFGSAADAVSKVVGSVASGAADYAKAAPQQAASSSQYTQQQPAVNANGQPITGAQAVGGANSSILAWVQQNWIVLILLLLALWVAIRLGWVK